MDDTNISGVLLRAASEDDIPFLEQVFLCALEDVITACRGGWDEERERRQFHDQLELESTRVIHYYGHDVGYMMVVTHENVGYMIVVTHENLTTLHTLCILWPSWNNSSC